MDIPVLLDALFIATIASGALLAAALIASRPFIQSGHVQHQLLAHAMLAGVAILALVVTFRPGPVGCLTGDCALDLERADGAARTQQYYTALAARKFSHLADRETRPDSRSQTSDPVSIPEGGALGPVHGTSWGKERFGVMLLGLWLIGVGISLARIGRRRRLARRFVREAGPVECAELAHRFATLTGRIGAGRKLRLLEHPNLAAPVVAGVLRPVILLPAGTKCGPDVDMIFLHELEHIQRRDPLVTLLCELASAVFWFNPLMWLAVRRMLELQELAADSRVVRDGILPSRYAGFLLDMFRELSSAGSVHLRHTHPIVGSCLMDTRVRMILDPTNTHRAPSRALSFAIAVGAGLLCAALSFAPAGLQARGLLAQEVRRGDDIDRSLLNAASIDSIVRPVFIDHMADHYIAGAAIAVVHEGNLVYREGFGRREVFHELPVDPDRTIWRIGSITKVLTAVAVMQLVDQGVLDLEANVNDYLTEFKIPATFDEPVRVRNLLTHTSGFDQIGLGRHVSSQEEVRPLGDFLKEYLVRIRPPNEVSTYDTYGITLAGYLVEQQSGLSYEEYLQRHVFQPLSMVRSGIVVPPALQADAATGYGFAGHWEAQRWEYMNTDPASTVNSTVVDMANFAIMLLEGGRFQGRQVLSEQSVRAMLTQQWTNDPDQPGYGLILWEDRSYGIPAFSHGGSMAGFSALLYLVPAHHFGVFIADNQGTGSVHGAVLSALMDALFPGRPETAELRPRWEGPDDISRFTGTYANSLYHHGDPTTGWQRQPFELTADDDGGLIFQGEPAYRVGPLAFQRADGLLLTFREDERGRISFLYVNQGVYERLPQP